MCKVLAYQYICTHYTVHRVSRCGGHVEKKSTKKDQERKAGCKATPYLTLRRNEDCAKCQKFTLLAPSRRSIACAKALLAYAQAKDFPFTVATMTELVADLEEDFKGEEWTAERRFPKGHSHVKRVELGRAWGEDERSGSLLRCETRREDVVEPGDKMGEVKSEEEIWESWAPGVKGYEAKAVVMAVAETETETKAETDVQELWAPAEGGEGEGEMGVELEDESEAMMWGDGEVWAEGDWDLGKRDAEGGGERIEPVRPKSREWMEVVDEDDDEGVQLALP